MTPDDIIRVRLRQQRLGPEKCATPAETVAWLGAVQAQDFPAAKWALGLRTRGATDASVEDAFNRGAILRTHVMRPTWHFVAPADIRSVLALTGPRVHAVNAHRYRELGLDRRLLSRSHAALTRALEGGQYLTRAELAERLVKNRIPAAGQALAYILMHAELEGLICSGPRRGKQFTYALLEERVPRGKALPRDDALAAWALRYFTGHGPAQLEDFAWWSGLTLADARRGLEAAARHLVSEVCSGKTYWFSVSPVTGSRAAPKALLLSIYDEYTIAYRDRRVLGEKRYVERLLSMGNALTAALVLDGKVVGTWKRAITRDALEVAISPFRPLRKEEREAFRAAAESYGAFLGVPRVTLQ